MCPTTYHF